MNRETIDFVIVDELATLVWTANLASLELHVPQWNASTRPASSRTADLLGSRPRPRPAGHDRRMLRGGAAVEGNSRGRRAHRLPQDQRLEGHAALRAAASPRPPTTPATTPGRSRSGWRSSGPKLVVSDMTKALRHGKVLVDWSQNNAAKTTVAPYSLRARPEPTVSTPITWAEVAGLRVGDRPVVHRARRARAHRAGRRSAGRPGHDCRQRSGPSCRGGAADRRRHRVVTR